MRRLPLAAAPRNNRCDICGLRAVTMNPANDGGWLYYCREHEPPHFIEIDDVTERRN